MSSGEVFMGNIGDIFLYFNHNSEKCLNAEEALLLSRGYDHIKYTDWPRARFTCHCPKLRKILHRIPSNLVDLVISFVVYPEFHTVLGDEFPFWSSDALMSLYPRFVVLNNAIHIPRRVFVKYGLQAFRQNASVFPVDAFEDNLCVYRSESVSDSTWGDGDYHMASETIVIFF